MSTGILSELEAARDEITRAVDAMAENASQDGTTAFLQARYLGVFKRISKVLSDCVGQDVPQIRTMPKRESVQAPARRCLLIDKDAQSCNHPESAEGHQCPGFSRDACPWYEPDTTCPGCGDKK